MAKNPPARGATKPAARNKQAIDSALDAAMAPPPIKTPGAKLGKNTLAQTGQNLGKPAKAAAVAVDNALMKQTKMAPKAPTARSQRVAAGKGARKVA